MEPLEPPESSVIISSFQLAKEIAKLTLLPNGVCHIIEQFAGHWLKSDYCNDPISSEELKSMLQSMNGFSVKFRCKLLSYNARKSWKTPYRLMIIKSIIQTGQPYLKLSFKYYSEKELKFLVYMRGLKRNEDTYICKIYSDGPQMFVSRSCCGGSTKVNNKSMKWNIFTESMIKYEYKMVDICVKFEWIQDKGYKIIIDSNQLKFIHFHRDRIANVKHLSEHSLEKVAIVGGSIFSIYCYDN